MDSAKKFNQNPVYGKINNLDLEDQSTTTTTNTTILPLNNQHKINKACVIFISIATVISIILLIISTLLSSSSSSSSSPPLLDSNSSDSIKLICNTTRYPDTCFKSISSYYTSPKKPDPESIFKLTLQIAIAEISTLSSFIGTVNLTATLAVKDCEELLTDAMSRLNDSVTVMNVGAGEKMLTDTKISDIQTWVSAALTDQETCTDGLEDIESTTVVDVKNKVEKSKEYVSNALAILANIVLLLDKFGQTLH